jgi:hypothetical protein
MTTLNKVLATMAQIYWPEMLLYAAFAVAWCLFAAFIMGAFE